MNLFLPVEVASSRFNRPIETELDRVAAFVPNAIAVRLWTVLIKG
jgi:hypothetical protein